MNLAELWNYMLLDMEAERFGNEMRQSAKRKLLLKQTEFLKEQQAKFAKVEADIEQLAQQLDELKKEADRLNALLGEIIEQNQDVDALDADALNERMTAAERLLASLNDCEKQIENVRREAESAERSQTEIKRRAAKTKAEYDAVKKEYDVEFAQDKVKLKQLREKAEKAAASLDKADLDRYKQIKLHCTPPMARLVNNQCTGCFMTLPVGTLREIKASNEPHTCDNCGRLLYPQD